MRFRDHTLKKAPVNPGKFWGVHLNSDNFLSEPMNIFCNFKRNYFTDRFVFAEIG